MTGLARDLENQAVGETQPGFALKVLESSCNDIGILQYELAMVEEHIDCARDRGRLAVIAGDQDTHRFGEHEKRNPRSVGDEVLCQWDLLRIVAGYETHEDIGLNGEHA